MNEFQQEKNSHPLTSLGFTEKALDNICWLCDAESMRALDRHVIEKIGLPGGALMENAAKSIADLLEEEVLLRFPSCRIVICCGNGNNGGDGFALARILVNRKYRVMVVDAGEAKTPDARTNQKVWTHFGESVSFPSADATRVIGEADLIIDAIFGTGLEREIGGAYWEWIETINSNNTAVKWAVDIPSGVNADDSRIHGTAVECTDTVCLQFGKIGCFQYPGASYAGRIHIPNISIPLKWDQVIDKDMPENLGTWLTSGPFVSELMPPRPVEAHKGTFGHLFNVCGSSGMGGAATLAATGALKNGTGLVTACVPSNLRDSIPGQVPELVTLSPPECTNFFQEEHAEYVLEESQTRNAVVIGCGLGVHSLTAGFVRTLCREMEGPLLIDADGLNNLDETALLGRSRPTVITPHPKELSRLCSLSVTEIQDSRIATVRQLSRKWGVVILLKGAYSVIGSPEGAVFINPVANPGLATAGSGDVLSGIIGGLLAQGLEPLDAAIAGAYLHGSAANCLLNDDPSIVLTASDLFKGIGMARKKLLPGNTA